MTVGSLVGILAVGWLVGAFWKLPSGSHHKAELPIPPLDDAAVTARMDQASAARVTELANVSGVAAAPPSPAKPTRRATSGELKRMFCTAAQSGNVSRARDAFRSLTNLGESAPQVVRKLDVPGKTLDSTTIKAIAGALKCDLGVGQ